MKQIRTICMTIAIMLLFTGCGKGAEQQTDSRESGSDAGWEISRGSEETEQSTGREESPSGEDGKESSMAASGEDAAQQTEASGESAGASAEASEAPEESVKLRDDYRDNFDVDEKEAAEFGRMIKEAVAQRDVEGLADLTGFPVYVGLADGIVVETRDAFIALDVEELLPEDMITSMAAADENSLSPSMAGFNLCGSDGAPSITFGVRDGSLAVSGINYGF